MNEDYVKWAMEEELPARLKIVLVVLAMKSVNGECTISIRELSKLCGMCRSSLHKATKELQENAIIEIFNQVCDVTGGNLASKYVLNIGA